MSEEFSHSRIFRLFYSSHRQCVVQETEFSFRIISVLLMFSHIIRFQTNTEWNKMIFILFLFFPLRNSIFSKFACWVIFEIAFGILFLSQCDSFFLCLSLSLTLCDSL